LSDPSHPAHSLVVPVGQDAAGNAIYEFRTTTRLTKKGVDLAPFKNRTG
jgi:hypothetical protein